MASPISAERIYCKVSNKKFYAAYGPKQGHKPHHQRLDSLTCPECEEHYAQEKDKNNDKAPQDDGRTAIS